MKNSSRSNPLFLFFFLGFIALLFLSLGADFPGHFKARILYGTFLLIFFLFLRWKIECRNFIFIPLAAFLIFQIVRFLGAIYSLYFIPTENAAAVLFAIQARSPLRWIFYFAFFLLAYSFFKQRESVSALVKGMSWFGFFLALNAIPPLLHNGSFGYLIEGNELRFFHPVFYFHPWASHYVLAVLTHSNFLGDIMAFGFFPALGLAFYSFRSLESKDREDAESADRKDRKRAIFSSLLLYMILGFVIGAAVFLLFSRGTIAFFFIASFFFLAACLLKFPSRPQLIFTLSVLMIGGAFFFWGGNLEKAWKEVQTLQKEADPKTRRSFATNVEGWNRALRIYKAYPVFGAGTGGYGAVAKRFAAPGLEKSDPLADFQTMCHYIQVLAEEGAGAFFYYSFILVYLWQMTKGLFTTRSRFKFLTGLSLFAPVLLILGHASINDLMERFSTSMLVYITMGAGLAVLRKDFGHP